jgi:hypothetical protein
VAVCNNQFTDRHGIGQFSVPNAGQETVSGAISKGAGSIAKSASRGNIP